MTLLERTFNVALTIRQAAERTHEVMNRKITCIQGVYSPRRTCCLGAHLADILNVGGSGLNDFTSGADAFAELMGANRAQAILLLRKAGAPHCPFGGSAPRHGRLKWRVPIETVWRNLMLIDELPETRGCNLAFEILSYASLERIDLENAQLQGASFDRAYLGACPPSKRQSPRRRTFPSESGQGRSVPRRFTICYCTQNHVPQSQPYGGRLIIR